MEPSWRSCDSLDTAEKAENLKKGKAKGTNNSKAKVIT